MKQAASLEQLGKTKSNRTGFRVTEVAFTTAVEAACLQQLWLVECGSR